MKTTTSYFSTLFISSLLCSFSCIGQSNTVYFGSTSSNVIGVCFSDSNLLVSAQSLIVSDMQLCLNNWGKMSELDLGTHIPGYAGQLYNFKRCPHYPESIDFPEYIVSNEASGVALQVTKKLSDAYTNAFAFATANSNIVAAAYEFVAFVSSSNFVSISSNALPNYIMFKNGLPDANAESNAIVNLAPQIIPDIRAQTYYRPSILGFYYSPAGPAATNLWMQVPCSIPTGWGPLGWNGSTVLWHDGKWRFCVWADWVP